MRSQGYAVLFGWVLGFAVLDLLLREWMPLLLNVWLLVLILVNVAVGGGRKPRSRRHDPGVRGGYKGGEAPGGRRPPPGPGATHPADSHTHSRVADVTSQAEYEGLNEEMFWLLSERRKEVFRRGVAKPETEAKIRRAQARLSEIDRERAESEAERLSSAGDNVVPFRRGRP